MHGIVLQMLVFILSNYEGSSIVLCVVTVLLEYYLGSLLGEMPQIIYSSLHSLFQREESRGIVSQTFVAYVILYYHYAIDEMF